MITNSFCLTQLGQNFSLIFYFTIPSLSALLAGWWTYKDRLKLKNMLQQEGIILLSISAIWLILVKIYNWGLCQLTRKDVDLYLQLLIVWFLAGMVLKWFLPRFRKSSFYPYFQKWLVYLGLFILGLMIVKASFSLYGVLRVKLFIYMTLAYCFTFWVVIPFFKNK